MIVLVLATYYASLLSRESMPDELKSTKIQTALTIGIPAGQKFLCGASHNGRRKEVERTKTIVLLTSFENGGLAVSLLLFKSFLFGF